MEILHISMFYILKKGLKPGLLVSCCRIQIKFRISSFASCFEYAKHPPPCF